MDAAELDALLSRAQEGDVRAFEELIGAHLGIVRRYARAFATNKNDADDLVQEALVKVYKSVRLFRYQSAFSTWLYVIVRNVFLDAARSRAAGERSKEEPLGPQATEKEGAPTPDELLAREQKRERVWIALRQVPEEFRTALVLFDIEGHSYDEVAAVEGVPVGTVKSRLSRGRAHLRRLLEPERTGAKDVAGEAGTAAQASSSHPGRSGS